MTQSVETSVFGLLYKIELPPTNQSQETITVMHERLLVLIYMVYVVLCVSVRVCVNEWWCKCVLA